MPIASWIALACWFGMLVLLVLVPVRQGVVDRLYWALCLCMGMALLWGHTSVM